MFSIIGALLHSVESLSDKSRQYFDTLVVFDYDTVIPLSVLETIWNVNIEEDEDADEYMNGM